MTKIAVLDDWQGIARSSTDWSLLMKRAEVVFFEHAFQDEDEVAGKNELWKCRPVESTESQKQAFHPFHRPWKARKNSSLPTFPQLRRSVLIKEGLRKAGLTAEPKTVTSGGGPK